MISLVWYYDSFALLQESEYRHAEYKQSDNPRLIEKVYGQEKSAGEVKISIQGSNNFAESEYIIFPQMQ